MNTEYGRVIAASEADRRALFATTDRLERDYESMQGKILARCPPSTSSWRRLSISNAN